MEIAGFALRDIVLAIAGVFGVYLMVAVLRLTRLRKKPADLPEAKLTPRLEAQTRDDSDDDDEPQENLVYAPPSPVRAEAAVPADFGAELARTHQDAELRRMREEVAQLREEVGQLRAEVADLKAARHVSPQYSDAMALAQRGLSAQDVADRCGISLGEAELVWALSRGPTNFDEEEDYGGEPGVEPARSA